MTTISRSFAVYTINLLLFATIVSSTQAQMFLTNGLLAYYPFNGNANDASGNGNNGVVQNATLTEDRFNVASRAYGFESLRQKIRTTSADGFPVSTNDFTLSFWVKTYSDSGTHQIFVCNDADQQFQIHMGPLQNGQTQIGFQAGGTGAGFTSFIPWILNQWYNVQVVRLQNTNIIIYRDGMQLSQQTTTLGNQATPEQQNLSFGYYTNGAGIERQFYGSLDDIRIYNRAFSESEVQQLYGFEAPSRLNIKKAVYVDSQTLKVGTNYQLQLSSDLINWTNYGASFTATNAIWRSINYWDVSDWGALFFRLQVP